MHSSAKVDLDTGTGGMRHCFGISQSVKSLFKKICQKTLVKICLECPASMGSHNPHKKRAQFTHINSDLFIGLPLKEVFLEDHFPLAG